ncbi:hypothetical protein H2200_007445 [Cladophialophora chaetospira]|uniref:Uncharacterized protein n=1 Tax=Cladophialophora chaetospira TaxID=386627 RepID=A0AA39CHI6_9EURO|nr:hypothetical protein H2200_007445 [Cladophialophora chaetospira]
MPGKWIRDDSQSLYYVDDEDDVPSVTTVQVVKSQANAHLRGPGEPFQALRLPSRHAWPAAREGISRLRKPEDRNYRQYGLTSALMDGSDEDRDRDLMLQPILKRKRASAGSFDTISLDHTFVHPLSGLNLVMGYNTSLPKSRLDFYITAMRQLIRGSSERRALAGDLQRAVSAEGVLWVVREAWPAAEGYWNLTATFRGFLHAELWRNFPCERSYRQLPAAYRPTRAQLAIPHSPMIDWMPWPDVRDMAIKFQDQIDLDDLFRVAIHNLVAHRKGRGKRRKSFRGDAIETPKLVEEVSDETSFRVWDVVCLEKASSTNPLAAEPDLKTRPVLRTPELRALSRAYNLEFDEFDTQKLDDGFFEAYPCLYADTAASGWKVKNFPNMSRVDVGSPVALTRLAVLRLKSKIESLVGSDIEL